MEEAKKRRIRSAIKRFDDAVRRHAWRGGVYPEDVPGIDEEYAEAKKHLWKVITGKEV